MRFLRSFLLVALGLPVALTSCSSSSGGGHLGNGALTTDPPVVSLGQPFSASFTPANPGAFPDVRILPVASDTTDFIEPLGGDKFVAHRPGGLYAVSGGQVLDYVNVPGPR